MIEQIGPTCDIRLSNDRTDWIGSTRDIRLCNDRTDRTYL